MTNQEILDNAPSECNHYTPDAEWQYDKRAFEVRSLADMARIVELEANQPEPLALYDFIETYEELPMMQLWDWLMYNGYTKRVQDDSMDVNAR